MTDPNALAQLLLGHVIDAGVVDLEGLRLNTKVELRRDSSIEVVWISQAALPPGCSIAATYDGDRTPARIAVVRENSHARRAFSLLHEYAHHLRDQVDAVLDVLEATRDSLRLEERMCDAFASAVLLPASMRVDAFIDGVRADGVVWLAGRATASAQAVAVAAAQHLPDDGYVLLLAPDATVNFAARGGDVLPVRPGTQQSGLLAQAASGRRLRGVARLTFPSGAESREYQVDTAPLDGQVVVVAVAGRAPWLPFSAKIDTHVASRRGWCENCDTEIESYSGVCARCGEPRCPACNACSCAAATAPSSRRCSGCFLVVGPGGFATADATHCLECAS